MQSPAFFDRHCEEEAVDVLVHACRFGAEAFV
jgi:hypothetical protein